MKPSVLTISLNSRGYGHIAVCREIVQQTLQLLKLTITAAAIPFSKKETAALASGVARQVQLSIWAAPSRRYAPLNSIDQQCT